MILLVSVPITSILREASQILLRLADLSAKAWERSFFAITAGEFMDLLAQSRQLSLQLAFRLVLDFSESCFGLCFLAGRGSGVLARSCVILRLRLAELRDLLANSGSRFFNLQGLEGIALSFDDRVSGLGLLFG